MRTSTNKGEKPKKGYKKLVMMLWLAFLAPVFLFITAFFLIANGWLWELPAFEELENPKSNLATEVYSSDLEVIGQYFSENRTKVEYHNISPFVISALVATEDERFHSHSGIDLRSTSRAVLNFGRSGGASTITQQLAKMLFHEKSRSTLGRIKQKMLEWVIATRLERKYTKEEIVTMYLNRFDFVNNAVGIKSAAKVYFNKDAKDLDLSESALLVGMAKNPSLFNPRRFADTSLHRRNVVFYQMMRNELITQIEFDSLKALPMKLDFQRVSHREGLAPYYREALRQDLARLFNKKDEDGKYIYSKNGEGKEKYNIYRDGLKVYTTIDSRLQAYAEWAVSKHLGGELQQDFWKDLRNKKNAPFDGEWSDKQVESAMKRARKGSDRYNVMIGKQCGNCGRRGDYVQHEEKDGKELLVCTADDCGFERPQVTDDSILRSFDTPVKMSLFSWKGNVDTVLTPNDSIKYYKSFLRAGMMSINPKNGFIKAWVGGINSNYFSYDHVRTAKRQVGSTFKPFVYALAMEGGYSPCYEIPNIDYTFHKGEYGLLKDWTPRNAGGNFDGNVSLQYGLANSMNNVTAWVMKQYSPAAVVEFAHRAGFTSELDTVPSLCLGVADITLYEMVSANTCFVNKGNWVEPIHLLMIEDKAGNKVFEAKQDYNNVMHEQIAYKVLQLMKGTADGVQNENDKYTYPIGTAIRLRGRREYGGIRYPLAGKTGTTQKHTDGWFMGLTPDLVTGVWVGGEDRSIRFRTLSKGMGTNMALPIWGYYMKKVWADEDLDISKKDFEAPEGINPFEFDCDGKGNNNGAEQNYEGRDEYDDEGGS